jgi:hypothetical protein
MFRKRYRYWFQLFLKPTLRKFLVVLTLPSSRCMLSLQPACRLAGHSASGYKPSFEKFLFWPDLKDKTGNLETELCTYVCMRSSLIVAI